MAQTKQTTVQTDTNQNDTQIFRLKFKMGGWGPNLTVDIFKTKVVQTED